MNMTTIALVTGCSGFIGRHCARELAANGYIVLGLDAAPMPEAQDWGIAHFWQTPINAAALDDAALRHGLPQCLIHCAGSGSVLASLQNPYADFMANVQSTLEALDFSRRNGAAVNVVLPSSAAVYGNISASPLAEAVAGQPASPYGVHKKIMEELATSYGQNFTVPSVCVRLFSVYGAGLKKQLLWDACRKAERGEFSFFGSGAEERDWLHVSDAARLLFLATEHASPSVPVVNGGTGQGTSIKEVLTMLGRAWSPALTPQFTGHTRTGDPDRLVADISRMREWEFTPRIPLEQGLHEYVRWFQGQMRHD
ncbi:MAG: NAD(P)-dependent oxidoreductase [Desulfovibrionaceae bacterium]|nr:NAD(P)-dependent oxidoreductase [Desulfovibrionaceae bacterium]